MSTPSSIPPSNSSYQLGFPSLTNESKYESKTPLADDKSTIVIGSPVNQFATTLFNTLVPVNISSSSSSSSLRSATVPYASAPNVVKVAAMEVKRSEVEVKKLFLSEQPDDVSAYVDPLFSDITERNTSYNTELKKHLPTMLQKLQTEYVREFEDQTKDKIEGDKDSKANMTIRLLRTKRKLELEDEIKSVKQTKDKLERDEGRSYYKDLKQYMTIRLQEELRTERKRRFNELIKTHAKVIEANLAEADQLELMDRQRQGCLFNCMRSSRQKAYHRELAIPRNATILGIKRKYPKEIKILLNNGCDHLLEQAQAPSFKQLQEDMDAFLDKKLDLSISEQECISRLNKIAYDLLWCSYMPNHELPLDRFKPWITTGESAVCHNVSRNFFKAALSHKGDACIKMPSELKDDEELMNIAISTDGFAACHASEDLRTRVFWIKAINQNPLVLGLEKPFVNEKDLAILQEFANSSQKMARAINQNGDVIKYAASHFQDDPEMACIAMANSTEDFPFRHLSERLRGDNKIFQLAITYTVQSWRYGTREAQTNPENINFVFETIRKNHNDCPSLKHEVTCLLEEAMGRRKKKEKELRQRLDTKLNAPSISDRLHALAQGHVLKTGYLGKIQPEEVEGRFFTDHPNKVAILKIVVAYYPEILPSLHGDLRNNQEIIEIAKLALSGLEVPALVNISPSKVSIETADNKQTMTFHFDEGAPEIIHFAPKQPIVNSRTAHSAKRGSLT